MLDDPGADELERGDVSLLRLARQVLDKAERPLATRVQKRIGPITPSRVRGRGGAPGHRLIPFAAQNRDAESLLQLDQETPFPE